MPIQSHFGIQLTAETVAARQDENHRVNHNFNTRYYSVSYTVSRYSPYMSNWALGKGLLSDFQGRMATQKKQKEDSNNH